MPKNRELLDGVNIATNVTSIFQQVAAKVSGIRVPRHGRIAPVIDRVICVSGAAALGKTRFCRSLAAWLRSRGTQATHIQLDGYLLLRDLRKRDDLSGYDPRATDFAKMVADLDALLRKGERRRVPVYSHASGRITKRALTTPRPVMILDGIMALHHEIRDRYPCVRLFFEADDLVLKGLRVEVDMKERNYSIFEALAHVERESREYDRWIHHQRGFADLRVQVHEDRHLTIIGGAA